MDLQSIQAYCLSLPGTEEDLKWGCDICFCVAGKMYAVLGLEEGKDPRLSFKTVPELFRELTRLPDIVPAPYLARYHWICLDRLSALEDETLKNLIYDSYRSILAKLPKKVRKGLEEKAASHRPPAPASGTHLAGERPTAPILLAREELENGFLLQLQVPENLLYFEGHFPKLPVVPGVCQLKWVFDAVRESTGRALHLQSMEAVKFHELLLPGQKFQMEIRSDPDSGKWRFLITSQEKKVASGRLLEGVPQPR